MGGAIRVLSGSIGLDVQACVFSRNLANATDGGAYGGAVAALALTLRIRNTTFTSNLALAMAGDQSAGKQAKGGAIFGSGITTPSLISNSTFRSNVAVVVFTSGYSDQGNYMVAAGGAIAMDWAVEGFNVTSSVFKKNAATFFPSTQALSSAQASGGECPDGTGKDWTSADRLA